MLAYEEIYNISKNRTNKPSYTPSTEHAESVIRRDIKIDGLETLIITNFPERDLLINEEYFIDIGLEEDNAFDGIGDDLGDSDNDVFGESGDDPFDSNNDDPFGDDSDFDPFKDSGENEEGKPKKELTISRKEILDNKFDMSKIVRKDFPDYIYKLKDVVRSAIDIIDRRQVHSDLSEVKMEIISRYRKTLNAIESYISILDSEAYEDIFTTYVKFWTILNKLKIAVNNLR